MRNPSATYEIDSAQQTIRILLIATFGSNIGNFLVFPVLGVDFMSHKGLSVSQVATIFGMMAIGKMLGSLLAGPLCDRVGGRRVLIAALIFRAAAFVMLVLFSQIWVLILASVFIRLGSGLYIPTAKAIISFIAPQAVKMPLLTRRSTVANAGIVLGPPLGLLIQSGLGENALYWLGSVIFVGLAAFHLRIADVRTTAASQLSGYLKDVQSVVRKRGFVQLVVFVLSFNFFYALFALIMPIYGRTNVSATAPQVTYIVNAGVVIAGQLLLGRRLVPANARRVAIAGFMSVGVAAFIMARSSGEIVLFAIGVAVYSIGEVVLLLKCDFLASDVGGGAIGATFSAAAVLEAIGGFVGNKAFGSIFGHFSAAQSWYLAGVLAMCMSVGVATVNCRRGES